MSIELFSATHRSLMHSSLTHRALSFGPPIEYGVQDPWAGMLSIDRPPDTASPPDDEFETSELAPKWTVVDGATGTVSLTSTQDSIFELFPDQSVIAIQGRDTGPVYLRQDYTLPDTRSLVLSAAIGMSTTSFPGFNDDANQIGLVLNDNDTDPFAGNYLKHHMDNDLNTHFIGTWNGTSSFKVPFPFHLGDKIYLRVIRDGLVYRSFFSVGGLTWVSLASYTYPGPLSNIWIFAGGLATQGNPTPIQVFDWIREGSSDQFPWSYV